MNKEERLVKFLKEHPEMEYDIRGFKRTIFRRKKENKRAEEMSDLFEEGWTYAEIGRLFDVTRERVRQILNSHYGSHFAEKRKEITELRRNLSKEARTIEVACKNCSELFKKDKFQNKKYCSKKCARDKRMVNEYPDWVGDRGISKENFTEEEWREINRIRTRQSYHRHIDKRREQSRRWQTKNKELQRIYSQRAYERREYGGRALTPLPGFRTPEDDNRIKP